MQIGIVEAWHEQLPEDDAIVYVWLFLESRGPAMDPKELGSYFKDTTKRTPNLEKKPYGDVGDYHDDGMKRLDLTLQQVLNQDVPLRGHKEVHGCKLPSFHRMPTKGPHVVGPSCRRERLQPGNLQYTGLDNGRHDFEVCSRYLLL